MYILQQCYAYKNNTCAYTNIIGVLRAANRDATLFSTLILLITKRKNVPNVYILDLRSTKKSTSRKYALASSGIITPLVSLKATTEYNRSALKTYSKSLQSIILTTPYNVTLNPYQKDNNNTIISRNLTTSRKRKEKKLYNQKLFQLIVRKLLYEKVYTIKIRQFNTLLDNTRLYYYS